MWLTHITMQITHISLCSPSLHQAFKVQWQSVVTIIVIFDARQWQYRETQIHWPSLSVIEITKKLCKAAIYMLSNPLNTTSMHSSAAIQWNLDFLLTILPVLTALKSCSHFRTFFLHCALGLRLRSSAHWWRWEERSKMADIGSTHCLCSVSVALVLLQSSAVATLEDVALDIS